MGCRRNQILLRIWAGAQVVKMAMPEFIDCTGSIWRLHRFVLRNSCIVSSYWEISNRQLPPKLCTQYCGQLQEIFGSCNFNLSKQETLRVCGCKPDEDLSQHDSFHANGAKAPIVNLGPPLTALANCRLTSGGNFWLLNFIICSDCEEVMSPPLSVPDHGNISIGVVVGRDAVLDATKTGRQFPFSC
jgi:hypothetical protein